jgi:hypothetical protein
MKGSSNPLSGSVPLNLRQDEEVVAKSTSYREGITHPTNYRIPQQDEPSLLRNEGCTPLLRYPNGRLDTEFVASQVIDMIHKAESGGNLTSFEQALLTLILPQKFQLVAPKIAGTMARLTDEERGLVALRVLRHMNEELNWNAGYGGGSVPFRHVTKD